VSRRVVAVGKRDTHSDPVGRIEEPLQPPRLGPRVYVRGVPARRHKVAAAGGQHPEIGEELVIALLAAARILGHPRAHGPGLDSLIPVPGGHQVQNHHTAGVEGIDRRAVPDEVRKSLMERTADVGEGVDAVCRECRQHHLPRR